MTDAELCAALRKLSVDMEKHATDDWDEHENVAAAADRIEALAAARDGFQQEAENYIDLLGKALAERDAAWNAAIRAAAKAAGDAAVTVLLRNEPNAPLIKRQVKRQSVAVPVLALLKL